MPAVSAVLTASLASARRGSMIPASPTNDSPWVSDIGSSVIVASSSSADQAGREREDPQALLAHPHVGLVDAGPRLCDRHLRAAERAARLAAARDDDVGCSLDQLDDVLDAVER